MIIDVHAHILPAEAKRFLLARGFDLMPSAAVPAGTAVDDSEADAARRIAMMDEAGVGMQVLSLVMPPPFPKAEDAIALARLVNDAHADLVRRYPDRFRAYVSLPLPHIDSALAELERGLDTLGMAGVCVMCSIGGVSAADPAFEPIYRELDRRGAVLFFHPCLSGICSPFIVDWKFVDSAGASLEDTALVLHMIARALPHRYPNIRMIVPHLGGLIPMQLNRLDNQVPPHHPDLPERPSVTAKRFWYDTVAHGSHAALRCACEAFGHEKLLPGSDYPALVKVERYGRSFDYIGEAGLPKTVADAILHQNANRLFNIQSAR